MERPDLPRVDRRGGDEYLLSLSRLSDAEREILRTGVGGRYEECEPASEGMAAPRDQPTEDARLPAPKYDAWYVAFEGDRYAPTIRRWVH